MRKVTLTFILAFLAVAALAQDPVRMTKNQSDCIGAYQVRDTLFGPVLSPVGFGQKLEIDGYELGNEHYFEKEHNTVWYAIKVPYDATFTFELIPLNPEDDFDFLLFDNPSPNFCANVQNGTAVPIRTNISRASGSVGGRTGLSTTSEVDYVPAGPGDPFSRAIEVKAGDRFVMVVDNPFKANEGHTLHLHYQRKHKATRMRDTIPEDEPEMEKQSINVTIVDKDSGEPVAADVVIFGASGEEARRTGQSSFVYEGEAYRSYTFRCDVEGYLFANKRVTAFKRDDLSVKIELQKIKPGVSISLNNIKFAGDKADILPESQKSLDQLVDFMQKNPSVKIEIQGHVNAPGVPNKGKYKKLSGARAEAVFTALFNEGIERSRMTYKGYGNSKPIYDDPKSELQAEFNRRVEIRVLSR